MVNPYRKLKKKEDIIFKRREIRKKKEETRKNIEKQNLGHVMLQKRESTWEFLNKI